MFSPLDMWVEGLAFWAWAILKATRMVPGVKRSIARCWMNQAPHLGPQEIDLRYEEEISVSSGLGILEKRDSRRWKNLKCLKINPLKCKGSGEAVEVFLGKMRLPKEGSEEVLFKASSRRGIEVTWEDGYIRPMRLNGNVMSPERGKSPALL